MNHDLLSGDDMRLLTEIGMLGAGAGLPLRASTETLFRKLMVLRPSRDFAYIGLACTYLNLGRPDDAVRVLERGLQIMDSTADDTPTSDRAMVQAFLGMALLMARRTAEAMALLNTLAQNCQHGPALRMARGLLGLPAQDTLKETP